ncbi:EAL domain-containing protein [Thalassotalea euphylliae]|uniref:EAL domain-containing response regulator n=1 Tax=Thalassotalea euphylliae TaxID=1655234 RepID=UPI003629F749
MEVVSSEISALSLLVVEDDKFQRLALVQMVKKLGLKDVFSAGDGEKALEFLDLRSFDVIICDLSMPNMDGLALIRQLSKSSFAGSILVSSALDASLIRSAKALAKSLGLNMLGAIAKPLQPKSLTDALARHFVPHHNSVIHKPKTFEFTVADVEHAIANREIVPYFQPQTCMKTGKLIGVEALARWNHPTHGVIGPDTFIPLAEEKDDLIAELTEQMFMHSLQEMAKLPAAFEKLRLSINISSKSLRDNVIQYLLLNLNQINNQKSRKVTLELTEQACISDPMMALEILTRLRMNGFQLSLDDFGTGYSTMEQIGQYPFNELKIDRSFVGKMLVDHSAYAIVESCVRLGRTLGMQVIAEGVETYQQWHVLQKLGCDQCQGYLISKPIELHQLIPTMQRWLKEYHTNIASISSEPAKAS